MSDALLRLYTRSSVVCGHEVCTARLSKRKHFSRPQLVSELVSEKRDFPSETDLS